MCRAVAASRISLIRSAATVAAPGDHALPVKPPSPAGVGDLPDLDVVVRPAGEQRLEVGGVAVHGVDVQPGRSVGADHSCAPTCSSSLG